MNPTPEQLAFAFAMLSLRDRSASDESIVREESLDLWSSLFRIVAIAVIGLSTGLMGLSYLENRVATGGRSEIELHALTSPSPNYQEVLEKTTLDDTDLERTAAAD